MATVQEKIELLHEKLAKVKAGGGEKRVEKQHAQGKMTARERLAKLFDDNSFVELDQFVKHRCVNFGQEKKELPGEGVVTGYGTIDGRLVYAFAQDFTVEGGSLGEMHAAKIVKVQRLAMKMGAPIVGINDSGGARIQEAVDALAGYGKIFFENTNASPGHDFWTVNRHLYAPDCEASGVRSGLCLRPERRLSVGLFLLSVVICELGHGHIYQLALFLQISVILTSVTV